MKKIMHNNRIYSVKFNIFERLKMIFIDKIKYKEIFSMDGNIFYLPHKNVYFKYDPIRGMQILSNRIINYEIKREIEYFKDKYEKLEDDYNRLKMENHNLKIELKNSLELKNYYNSNIELLEKNNLNEQLRWLNGAMKYADKNRRKNSGKKKRILQGKQR